VRFSKAGGLRIEMPEGAPAGAYAHAFELTGVK
jgi:hypothetical protein